MFGVSTLVLLLSYRGWWPIGIAEAWGFVTGGVCVWLVVREHLRRTGNLRRRRHAG